MKMSHRRIIGLVIDRPQVKIGFQNTEGRFYFSYYIIYCPLSLFIILVKISTQQIITMFIFNGLLVPGDIGNNPLFIHPGYYFVMLMSAGVFGFEPAYSFPYFFLLFYTAFLIKAFFYLRKPLFKALAEAAVHA